MLVLQFPFSGGVHQTGADLIAQSFNISLNAVSKHLKVLERAGVVERRREGTTHFISMRWEGLAPIVGWLHGGSPTERGRRDGPDLCRARQQAKESETAAKHRLNKFLLRRDKHDSGKSRWTVAFWKCPALPCPA
nr:helix-turn-helix domain-containing protein [Enhygromyxa salina]